ncbi:PAS domain-containing protein, partial [Thermodesulfobacteriota bacterium]
PVTKMREKMLEKCQSPNGFEYLIMDSTEVDGGSRKARRLYMKSLQKWHARHPIKMYILYGTNRFMKAAAYIAGPLMPFKVKVAKNLEEALEMTGGSLLKAEQPQPVIKSQVEKGKGFNPYQRYVDELLTYLGSIDWEQDGLDGSEQIDPSHPFHKVFEAILLVKEELDGLLQERKQVEDLVRESEERYRRILQDIQDGYYEVDIAGNFTFTNPSMSRILGYREDELIGMNNQKYMDPDTAEQVYGCFNRVYSTGRSDEGVGWEFIRKDGTRRYVESPDEGCQRTANRLQGYSAGYDAKEAGRGGNAQIP